VPLDDRHGGWGSFTTGVPSRAFGTVLVAAALPKGRSPTAQALLATLVDEAKQTGVVQNAIDAKGLKGVNVVTK
jgi:polar amino acid transport system substrate-binding protein